MQRYYWDEESGALFADDRGGFVVCADAEAAIADAYERGKADERASWQDVLTSTNHRAAMDERARIRNGVVEHFKVAPKAALSLLKIIDNEKKAGSDEVPTQQAD